MPDEQLLTYYQALPLSIKILMSRERIREWYNHWAGRVCVSFSGGKDSTVLADLVHRWYPEVPLFYINTGLEYPEVQAFARRKGAVFIRPRLRFDEVISQYGYPLISKENSEAIQYCRRIIHAGKEVNYEKSVLSSREAMLNNTSKKFNRQKWLPLTRDTHFRISHYCCYMLKKSPVSPTSCPSTPASRARISMPLKRNSRARATATSSSLSVKPVPMHSRLSAPVSPS